MFGVSFPELLLVGAVALIIVGPQRLPGMLGTLGKWSNKLRRMLFDVRQQSGIDDILRAEGISGGLKEIRDLRNAVRGNVSGLLTAGAVGPRQGVQNQPRQPIVAAPPAVVPTEVVTDPYADVPYDRTREYPDEGCDAYGAIPDDLWAAAHATNTPPTPAQSTGAVASTSTAAVAPTSTAVASTSTGVAPTSAAVAPTSAAAAAIASSAVAPAAEGAVSNDVAVLPNVGTAVVAAGVAHGVVASVTSSSHAATDEQPSAAPQESEPDAPPTDAASAVALDVDSDDSDDSEPTAT